MKKIVVLGAGLVGNVIARDLTKDPEIEVSVADINQKALDFLKSNFNIQGIKADLSNTENLKKIIADFDLVVGAVPGFMGYQTLKTVIEEGKDIVDISFFDEDPFSLSELAKEKGVTAVIDCGVAPGLSNIILGYVNSILEKVESFLCYVGGLPVIRTWPYEYKAPFSPIDVIEEYTRPARFVENGKVVVKPALSDPELLEFEGIGSLEAFNTDGLRTLLKTMPHIPNLKEKTLRYPGHIEKMKILRETGFFGKEDIEIKGVKIKPIDLTTKLLFEEWKLRPGEEDYTIMEIEVEGKHENKIVQHRYYLLDKYDKQEQMISMARTTGFTCSIIANLVVKGKYAPKTLVPPELIGENHEVFEILINELEKRNVCFKTTVRELKIRNN
ncbi:MAG: saccharopine dehydrogenase C-terminal domain-containing protein [Candidatus Heimdallarchaeaceae archaeon]